MSNKKGQKETISGDEDVGVRERILKAAMRILRKEGISELSQVSVSRKAGVRQSHLTYYFPKRQDLISAVAERVVGELVSTARETLSGSEEKDIFTIFKQLSLSISRQEHMRMLTGAIVEADRDPEVKAIVLRETKRMREALADLLGGKNEEERARFLQATLWGIGLYTFVAGESERPDAAFLSRLTG